MATPVQSLLDAILDEGAFDASSAQALRWLDRRHKQMVARSLCNRAAYSPASLTVAADGLTVATLNPANVPVQVFSVTVNDSQVFAPARHADRQGYLAGTLRWSGSDGLFIAERGTGAVASALTLFPPLDASAVGSVAVYGAWAAPTLQQSDMSVLVDDEAVEGLLAGVFATALGRPDEARLDLAEVYEQQFAGACEELRLRVQRQFRGRGLQIRLAPSVW